MKRNFAIIGLGRFGGSICQTLVEASQEALAINSSKDRVNKYMNIATHVVVTSAQDEMTLRSLEIRNFDRAVVAIGKGVQAGILVMLMVKRVGVPNVLTKAVGEYHVRVLDRIGADMVVHPERDTDIRIAHEPVSRNISDYIELSSEFSLAGVRVANPKFYSKTLAELNFHRRFGLAVVAIHCSKTEVIASPNTSEIVRGNDDSLVIGDTADVDLLGEKISS